MNEEFGQPTDPRLPPIDPEAPTQRPGPPTPPPLPTDAPFRPGTLFGRYAIRAVLGRGGMGVVYRAEQDRPHREVALKVINPGLLIGWRDAGASSRRFEIECELLGRLCHDGIAQVYEAGIDEATGTPYFAMELVEGEPLTSYAAAHSLSTRHRLDLIAKICDAVHHAHQKGVIHRDLKPGNILVTPEGQPKVLDFGVAKATDADIQATTLQTNIGQLIGTIPYMSPEQAGGDPADLDTRSDVYALGVVLYELLAGRLPYAIERRMVHEAVRIIREDDPTPLSSVNRTLRGDVEIIVGRALEKDKNRRYQSARELGADIRRYLRDEPIIARPPSAAYQARKFARRNKALVGGVAATFLALAAGLVAATVMYARAEAARADAVAAETEARQRADELEQVASFQESQLAGIDTALMGVNLRRDIIENRREALQNRSLGQEQIDAALSELESSLAGVNFTGVALGALEENIFERALGAIHEQFKDKLLIQARLLQTLAQTMYSLGLLDGGAAPQAEALAIRRRLLGDEHPDTLTSISGMAYLLVVRGEFAGAEAYYREALETCRRVFGDDHPDTLKAVSSLGGLLQLQGRLAEAEPYCREALEGHRRILGNDHPDTLKTISDMGALLDAQGRLDEAEVYYREAMEAHRRVLGEGDTRTLVTINNMGFWLYARGRLDEAAEHFREALRLSRRALGDEHPDTLQYINNVGALLLQMDKPAEAEPYCREALRTSRRVLGDEHPQTLLSLNNMAALLAAQGKYAESEPYIREAVTIRRRVLGEEHPDTLFSISNLGVQLRQLGQLEEAERLGAEAVGTARRVLPAENWNTGMFLLEHSRTLATLSRYADAETRALEAVKIFGSALGSQHAHTIETVRHLALLYDAWHEAEPGAGHDAAAAEWRTRIDETDAAAAPTPDGG